MNKIIKLQFFVLLAGAIFAWFNFSQELFAWLNSTVCTIGCKAGVNPFLTPCFGGVIFFTTAFILHLIIMKKSK